MNRFIINLCCVFFLLSPAAYSEPLVELAAESKIKVALIYKLMKFVTWPQRAFETDNSPLKLCLLGRGQVAEALTALAQRKVNGRSIVLDYPAAESPGFGDECHILYVGSASEGGVETLLRSLNGRTILTVSDIESFAEMGGIVELVNRKSRIGVAINLSSAKQAELKIASPLLNLATVIQAAEEGRD